MKNLIIASLLATASLAQANDIVLSEKIKSSLQAKIQRDMTILDNFKFKEADARTLEVMGLSTLNSTTSAKWLQERVSYVIEEDALTPLKLILKKVIYVERKDVTYPNQNIIPYSQDPSNQVTPLLDPSQTQEKQVLTVMSNMGAALYSGGKSSRTLYGMKVSRGLLKKQIKIAVDSPRAGIIQIGEGLFADGLTVNKENSNALANSINRLGTFFHEARHSDGNAASLTFSHAKCPVGHNYAGEYACDESLNGPYTVGYMMMNEMRKSCDENCSAADQEVLKTIILDYASRVLHTTYKGTPAVDWDATPERL